ncbi:MAG: hypothetical protein KBS59_02105 [Clostridiales bacterium]|nr:hypothetical protein [Clostridiales bacterium]
MQYFSNTDTLFLFKKIGDILVSYRLFRSDSERGGFFLLVSGQTPERIDDVFIPYVSEERREAEAITEYLFNNNVTPATAPDLLDSYFDVLK